MTVLQKHWTKPCPGEYRMKTANTKAIFIQFHLWNSTLIRGSNAYFTLNQNHYRYLKMWQHHILNYCCLTKCCVEKTLNFNYRRLCIPRWCLLAFLTFSNSSHSPHELLVVCNLPGIAYNWKLRQTLLEILGCYSSVNKLKLCK